MSATAIPFEVVFDPDFLAAVSHLTLTVDRIGGGGRHGERLSRDLGSGLEFRDYRPYTPGDDVRRIDWNIYRRLGKTFLRLHEDEQELPIYLLPDVSASMFLESVPRAWAALRCTLALAAISLHHHDSVAVFPFANDVDLRFTPLSGRAGTLRLARYLAELMPSNRARTALAAAIQRVAVTRLRRGVLIVISDFFVPEGLDALREALKQVRHRVLLVQLTRASDPAPDLRGEVRLTDCETGDATEVTVTTSALSRYREVYERFTRELAALAQQFNGRLIRVDADADLVLQLHEALSPGHLRA